MARLAGKEILTPAPEDVRSIKNGGRTRARTWDPLIKSQLLYQLSYASVPCRAERPSRRAGGGLQAAQARRRSRRFWRSIDISAPRQIITVSIADPPHDTKGRG